ncbi:methylcrotonoyl-CoA carboxylase subunit alpha, mitochondrial [Toxorhynchites rutilus septentrionalis]|uniref:methylcrotonoyl-CoA carboxylase subunit alpha, mitochondrial n=1 Tax=Toxorhynchites rutilus septentrionalis TaxID=329112 RepID=UPI00247A5620|nr:methylcrotonoyl-CoA carboxylase subunit alpha, mitochondrial [Toxorhynchites rutilus septentrionalis]
MLFKIRHALAGARYFSTSPRHGAKNATQQISKLLIANRGEIACRVMRTANRLGIQTVAVFSDADELSLHVKMANEAFNIGPPASQRSYLRGEKILEVAKRAGCQAIHPGYGFLSENVEFAELCQQEGMIFIGPPASAIRDMGIKSTSKHIMSEAGVPIINGYHGEDQSDERLIREARTIGFPLMIKAVRGGGGKGMRIAESEADFLPALQSARTESEKAFGDKSMLLERYVRSPRHVEVQVFADHYGNAVYLYERDCSVQRRHQKIIEEAPAPGLSEELRVQLGEAAVRAAKAVNYVGAGTVEFILDKEDLSFHFMEMNTRLQVEHPITEMITGTDLVEWQIKVASGEQLPLTQEQIHKKGHAFEARIYAEDPAGGFLPGAGPLNYLSTPEPSNTTRVETGVRQGDEVSIHYDPMIAKLVVWGENRSSALQLLVEQLRNYQIAGLQTNINFLIDLASHGHFRAADVHTGFIEQHMATLFPAKTVSSEKVAQMAVAQVLNEIGSTRRLLNHLNPFDVELDFRPNYIPARSFKLKIGEKVHLVEIKSMGDDFQVKVDAGEWLQISANRKLHGNRFLLQTNINGHVSTFNTVIENGCIDMFDDNGLTSAELVQPEFLKAESAFDQANVSSVTAPMPGVLDKVFVKAGDAVKAGTPLAVLIAMKMEHVLKAAKDGIVKAVPNVEGTNVKKGAVLIAFE